MTPKEKAKELVDKYRIILMDEDTDCGNEVLCTLIAIKNSKLAVDEILNQRFYQLKDYKKITQLCGGFKTDKDFDENLEHIHGQLENYGIHSVFYWQEVKHEIEKL